MSYNDTSTDTVIIKKIIISWSWMVNANELASVWSNQITVYCNQFIATKNQREKRKKFKKKQRQHYIYAKDTFLGQFNVKKIRRNDHACNFLFKK